MPKSPPTRAKHPLRSWSYSALKTFEECPYKSKLSKIDRIPELPRPDPGVSRDGTPKEHGNDRGSRIHQAAEDYVSGKRSDLIVELSKFTTEFKVLRDKHKDGTVLLEHNWCFNIAWEPVPANDPSTWLRVVIDALSFMSPQEAVVIDHKSGKRFGNEISHASQTQLYQLATLMKFQELEKVHTELWYTDVDDLVTSTFNRRIGTRYLKGFNERALLMTSTVDFKPKPSKHACMFCPYAPEEYSNKWVNKNGACKYGCN